MSDFTPAVSDELNESKIQCSNVGESRMGLAARRAAQLPKLRDLMRKQRPDSMDMDMIGGVNALDPDLDFHYADADNLLQEISELYSYSEEEEFLENAEAFSKFAESHSIFLWSRVSTHLRKSLIFSLLEELELCSVERRHNALQCLTYLLQGNFMECGENDEDFVKLLTSNVYLLYECGAWPSLLTLFLLELDVPAPANVGAPTRRASLNLSDCRWLRVVLSCLYTILEVLRRDDRDIWREQHKISDQEIARRAVLRENFLSELGHPLPGCDQCLATILFDTVTRYCTSLCPHYPIKKILLLLWKTILTWLGDFERLKSMKNEIRRRHGLPPCEDTITVARTMEAVPPPCLPSNVIVDLICGGGGSNPAAGADGEMAVPKRERPPLAKRQLACMSSDGDNGNGKDDEGFEDVPEDPLPKRDQDGGEQQQEQRADSPRPVVSPPPPPAAVQQPPVKALSWTLKVRPQDVETFLERERAKFFKFQIPDDKKTLAGLPRPILDSFETLNKHLYVSLADKQIDKEELLNKYSFSTCEDIDDQDGEPASAEILYRSILPQIAQYIIGLLKILLAGAPTSKPKTDAMNLFAEIAPANGEFSSSSSGNASFDQTSISARMALEVNRHKEILVKSISALLLLLLKHFKLNHVYQFEYVSQHLVFANCIPLILKFFDQNILLYVQSENEIPPACFPTSMLNYAKTKERNPQIVANWFDDNLKESGGKTKQGYFLWRNMFAAVNLLRILNKLTKWKHARTMMLVVFKSAPVLKRALRVKHILLQLYALKLLKMQAKYLGRQWRKTNMELMSAIYNKVRHRLNDNWAYGNETQAKPWDFQSEEANLRAAVEKFNLRRYRDILKLGVSGDSSPNSSSSDDDDFKPVDANVVSVLGVRYELTDRFKLNYEKWLEHEVFKAKIDWEMLLSSSRDYKSS